ncbi:fumarylacetoacetate hydrolase family protein [Paraburkholderia dipogonis]|uniref:Fumarylacetoacetate hydrolase family protein n=1 Tax=Paraburkholderia dipogonis TaxID=1211383 RepID=A0A4Y8MKR6_9BURK|nr:fumarylacetoacetate hydrolase family protein [Paraburkholderia dipogonis]TFE38060.1 fumarylacetoacetate hydrolase family protein [Paraburkholderia dipogonis]
MRLVCFECDGRKKIGVRVDQKIIPLAAHRAATIEDVLKIPNFQSALAGEIAAGAPDAIALTDVKLLPPVGPANRIFCVGLNYYEHVAETQGSDEPAPPQKPPAPTIFLRVLSSFVGDGLPLQLPSISDKFDWEGELVAVIGRPGYRISVERALDHVAGYSIGNDGSIRDWQLASTQWTMGKNFDKSGSIGPEIVTADELPFGARGLRIQTRLNGKVMQEDTTDNMMFDLPTLIAYLSQAVKLETGDLILTGTPSGIGITRKPPVLMAAEDICEVEIEQIGVLRNRIEREL